MQDVVGQYEQEFARVAQAPQARAFVLGRMGLYAALKALDVGAGDRVGICGYTCLSVTEAVLRCGAECEFLDVDEWINVSPTSLAALPTGRIKVLVTQYTFGVPSGLEEALTWAKANSVPVIEDCCHALGSRWRGRHVGSFGVAAIYSAQWGKSYSTGQGGMLTINDRDLAGEVDALLARQCRPMGRLSDASLACQRLLRQTLVGPRMFRAVRGLYHLTSRAGLTRGSFSAGLDFSDSTGFVERAGWLMARAGLAQLRRWPQRLAERQRNAERIGACLRSAAVSIPAWPEQADPVPLRFPIRVGNKAEVLAAADPRTDLAGWYDSPVHPLDAEDLARIGYTGQCPQAEAAIASLVHLPTARELPTARLDKIAGLLKPHALP